MSEPYCIAHLVEQLLGLWCQRSSGNSVLLKERSHYTMPMGSAKKPGRRYHTEGFWKYRLSAILRLSPKS